MADQRPNNTPDTIAKDDKLTEPIDVIEDDGTLDGCGEPAVGIEEALQKAAERVDERAHKPVPSKPA